MMGCKPAIIPVKPGNKPKELQDNTLTDKLRYQKLVEKLIYFPHTRPDICYVVSFVSQFMHDLTIEHP